MIGNGWLNVQKFAIEAPYHPVPKSTSIDTLVRCVCSEFFVLYFKSLMMSFIPGILKHCTFF